MPNHMKFCGCKTCRTGRHRPGAQSMITRANRSLRHGAKTALVKGKEPPDKTSIGYSYTD